MTAVCGMIAVVYPTRTDTVTCDMRVGGATCATCSGSRLHSASGFRVSLCAVSPPDRAVTGSFLFVFAIGTESLCSVRRSHRSARLSRPLGRHNVP